MSVRYDFAGVKIGVLSLLPTSAVMLAPQWLSLPVWVSVAAAVAAVPVFLMTFLRVMAPPDRVLLKDYMPRRVWGIVTALALIAPQTDLRQEGASAVLAPAGPPMETSKP